MRSLTEMQSLGLIQGLGQQVLEESRLYDGDTQPAEHK